MLPQRKTARLRHGRVSVPGARYFVTFCTKNRVPALAEARWRATAVAALECVDAQHDVRLLAATVMPDHVHILFELQDRLPVGRVIAKIKAMTREQGRAAWQWQSDGFERRLRPNETTEDYGFYVFMNPYRAGLVALDERWEAWICPEPTRFRFLEATRADGTPQPEWLGLTDDVANRIVVGE